MDYKITNLRWNKKFITQKYRPHMLQFWIRFWIKRDKNWKQWNLGAQWG